MTSTVPSESCLRRSTMGTKGPLNEGMTLPTAFAAPVEETFRLAGVPGSIQTQGSLAQQWYTHLGEPVMVATLSAYTDATDRLGAARAGSAVWEVSCTGGYAVGDAGEQGQGTIQSCSV